MENQDSRGLVGSTPSRREIVLVMANSSTTVEMEVEPAVHHSRYWPVALWCCLFTGRGITLARTHQCYEGFRGDDCDVFILLQ